MSSKDDPEFKLTVFVIKEHRTKFLGASAVPTKAGQEINISSEYFTSFIEELGFKNSPVVLKADNEPAIQAVLNAVVAARSAPTRIEPAPLGAGLRMAWGGVQPDALTPLHTAPSCPARTQHSLSVVRLSGHGMMMFIIGQ